LHIYTINKRYISIIIQDVDQIASEDSASLPPRQHFYPLFLGDLLHACLEDFNITPIGFLEVWANVKFGLFLLPLFVEVEVAVSTVDLFLKKLSLKLRVDFLEHQKLGFPIF